MPPLDTEHHVLRVSRYHAVLLAIPDDQQRYPTAGDYWREPDGGWTVTASACSDWRYERLLLIHELVELTLLEHAGIAEPDVMAFDLMYERERQAGLHSAEDEPGNDPRAPYRDQHFLATKVEQLLAAALGVDWKAYDAELTLLGRGPK